MWARTRNGIDEAVLAELRAIRSEIHDLSERVGQAATREDLDGYVRLEAFEAWKNGETRARSAIVQWAPYALSVGALAWTIFWTTIGQHLAWVH